MHPELVNLVLFVRCLWKVGLMTGLIFGAALVVFWEWVVFAEFKSSKKERHPHVSRASSQS
jgi:hypothetical protein